MEKIDDFLPHFGYWKKVVKNGFQMSKNNKLSLTSKKMINDFGKFCEKITKCKKSLLWWFWFGQNDFRAYVF